MTTAALSDPVVVAGGGVSGLYAALLLARRGRRVRVLERASEPGGLAAGQRFRGIPCDLGSHRLHPQALSRPLFRELARTERLLTRPRRGVLLLGGRHVPYPPNALALLRALGLRAGIELGLGLLTRRDRRRAFARWDDDRVRSPDDSGDVGFERFVIDRVGEAAYRAFYAPYAQKVWGLPPSELSQTVAKKRVSTTHPWTLLTSAIGGAARHLSGRPDDAIDRFVYPAGGIASVVSFLERELEKLGVEIECGRAFDRHSQKHAQPVLYAGDLRDVVPTTLEHRGLYLVFLALPIARVSAAETYYSPDPRYWFGRVSELQNYSPELKRRGETVLSVEIPEGSWGRGADFAGARRAELLAQLEDAGVVPRGIEPLEILERFVPNVYPLYRRGWLAEWRRAMQQLAQRPRFVPFGRQALFLHCNLDHCADIAADAVDHLESGGSTGAWIQKAERYLDLRVRD